MAHLVGHQKPVGVGADFFKRQKLDERVLEKLKNLMLSVAELLSVAEEKHIPELAAVKTWLDDLRHVMYEADDFLDEIYYNAIRLGMEADAPVTCCYKSVPFLNTFKKWMKKKPVKLEEILDRLRDLVSQKDVLRLINGIRGVPVTSRYPISLVNESLVYGRDADKDAMKKLLLSDDAADATNNFAVIPIVGMGGLGKSTLARIVFDEAVQFELKEWVCISEEDNVKRIIKGILNTPEASHTSTLEELFIQLKEKLQGKRYLLVFDDVWQHRWAEIWYTLETILSRGRRGSRIIVTTREHEVAHVMHAAPYALKKLSDEDSRKLLARHALGCENYSCLNSVRSQIFEEIVQKSNGLPLACRIMGRLMYGKDAHSWEAIAQSNLWNSPGNVEILPTLRMSYYHLPSHLKQCFAYCAIIPKGYEFRKEEMVRLWMAEGFLGGPKEQANMVIEEESMEALGRAYFDDLVSRSLFHQQDDEGEGFIMHDQIIDLARSVSGEFCHTFESEGACNITGRARHASCRKLGAYNLLQRCKHGAKSLRTFLPFPMRKGYVVNSEFNDEVLDDLLSTLKCLRVLSLSGYCYIYNLPDSIGGMKHLRYFDLSRTTIRFLPQAVGLLYNLETLILEDCAMLTMLPDSIGNLCSLYYLNIDGTAITTLPESLIRLHELQTFILGGSLEVMPPVGQLRNLKQLSRFIVGREGRSRARELGQLNLLRGKLSICNLENIVNAEDALEARLKDKERLAELVLVWNSSTWIPGSFNVLENLEPCMMLERLSVYGYGAPRFPSWMGDSSFLFMVELELNDCENCSSLPALGQLPSLKKLFIKGFSSLVIVGLEFYGSCTSREPFGSLEELYFEDMPEWSEWIPHRQAESSESGGPFPLLQKLVIASCPKLRCQQIVGSLPRPRPCMSFYMRMEDDSRDMKIDRFGLRVNHSGSIDPIVELIRHPVFLPSSWEEIHICNWDSLDCLRSLLNFSGEGIGPNVKELHVGDCSNLKSLPLLPSVEYLNIWGCPELDSFPEWGPASALQVLSIDGCDMLVGGCFPEETVLPSTLTSLTLTRLQNLTSWASEELQRLPSLKQLEIIDCPLVESLPEGELLPKLEELFISGCKTLVANRLQWNLQSFPSLKSFRIKECDDLESFPEEMLLPSTLALLGMTNFDNMTALNYNGLRHLTSLTELLIYNCPKLQSLPDEGLPSSLSSLTIRFCPLLTQRCARGTGEDWPKISRIPKTRIDLHQL